MNAREFERVVIMAVDRRPASFAAETASLLEGVGVTAPQIFLNGRGVDGLAVEDYSMVHTTPPPATWHLPGGLFDYWLAYRRVVANALADGVESLLICEDDIELSPNFTAIEARSSVPDDWSLLYFGAMHYWASTPAAPVGPYVVRLNGGQVGIQAVGWRREAMRAFLELPIDRPLDWAIAGLHDVVPSYCLHPSIIRQKRGVVSTIEGGGEPFEATFIYKLRGAGVSSLGG